jgi:hypothetical protein
MNVQGYSYFTERRAADKRWVATVEEFPELRAESKIHNRALNDLYAQVEATIRKRHQAGEPFPKPPAREPDEATEFLKTLGLT